jgi:hypothetical protein
MDRQIFKEPTKLLTIQLLEIQLDAGSSNKGCHQTIWRFPEMGGTYPISSSILIGFTIQNQPAIGDPPFMETPMASFMDHMAYVESAGSLWKFVT